MQKQPSSKKILRPLKSSMKKSYKIKGGGQEIATNTSPFFTAWLFLYGYICVCYLFIYLFID